MLWYTFLSSRAAGHVQALCCHTTELILTSSPENKLHTAADVEVFVQGPRTTGDGAPMGELKAAAGGWLRPPEPRIGQKQS